VGRGLRELRGVRVPPEAWDLARLPAHLRMTYRVEDEDGTVVAEDKDLEALRARLRPPAAGRAHGRHAGLERHGMRSWELEALPRAVALPGTGGRVRAYPALVDEGGAVGVRALESAAEQRAAMAAGTRRLLALTVPSPDRWVRSRLDTPGQLALAAAPHGSLGAVLQDATQARHGRARRRGRGPRGTGRHGRSCARTWREAWPSARWPWSATSRRSWTRRGTSSAASRR
jgi:ATP-dependent helicase HrpA